ncbi:3-oxoacyl-[acyl-carrier-protein] synthase 2 [Elizabethkingia miricola]|nr:3-oxoacyl-[acyl-carrier-protein] synthase 2 [Elizabethkingia miricola]
MKRVVVTGLGTINPLGNNVEEFWSNITAGKSAGNKVTHFDSTRFRTQVACEVKDFDPLKYLDKNEIKRSDLFTQYALYSAAQAMEDANFDLTKMDPFDFGVIWGTGQGGMQTFENEVEII